MENLPVQGDGVTIVLVDGRLRINGNSTMQLSAPAYSPDPTPAVPGLLIYMPPSNTTNDVHINGNSDSYFEGVILAPRAEVEYTGTGNTRMNKAQVIGWDVQTGGTADLSIVFDASQIYHKPTYMELYR